MKSLRICAFPILALLLIFAAAGMAAAQSAKLDHAHIARDALKKHIQPGYRRLTDAFASLEQGAADACASPGAAKLEALRGRFIDAVRAWGAIAHIGFGPIGTDNRYERIWFWPDRKAIGQRQVANALRGKPKDYTDAGSLSAKSIAVQGLGALEQILYGSGAKLLSAADAEASFPCRYAKAIAANLQSIATGIAADWREDGAFGRLWLTPGLENRSFLTDKETTFTLIRTAMDSLERVRDAELARPLGVTTSRRILPGPFSKSGSTMVFIAARIAGIRSLILDSGLAADMTRLAKAKRDRQSEGDVSQLLFELQQVERRAAELAQIADILGGSSRRSEAAALGYALKSARIAFANAAGRLTNLPMGYNASDGD
jgi:predicted lipoprotein